MTKRAPKAKKSKVETPQVMTEEPKVEAAPPEPAQPAPPKPEPPKPEPPRIVRDSSGKVMEYEAPLPKQPEMVKKATKFVEAPKLSTVMALRAERVRRRDVVLTWGSDQKHEAQAKVTTAIAPLVRKRDEAVMAERRKVEAQISKFRQDMAKLIARSRNKITTHFERKISGVSQMYEHIRKAEHDKVDVVLKKAEIEMKDAYDKIGSEMQSRLAEVEAWYEGEFKRIEAEEKARAEEKAKADEQKAKDSAPAAEVSPAPGPEAPVAEAPAPEAP